MPGHSAANRNHAMDNLRVVVVFLVVVLHAIITYMEFAPQWWYVLDPQRSIAFTYMTLLIDVPIMQIMFFLAGYYAIPSLTRYGAGQFLGSKIRRIGIPWILGVFLLAPPTAYMIYYSRHAPMSLWTFWQTDFWGPAYQQSVYWFLGVLLALFAVTALAFSIGPMRRLIARIPVIHQPALWQAALFVIALTAVSTLIALHSTLDQWSNNVLFVYQPVRVPDYIGYFCLGLYAGRCGWFTESGFCPRLRRWGPAWVLSGLVYVLWRMTPQPELPALAVKGVAIGLFNLFCLTSLLTLIALFQRHVSSHGGFWQAQTRNSYGIYYLHPLVLYPLALLLVPVTISIFLKAIILVLASYILSLAASGLVLTRLPGLRRVF